MCSPLQTITTDAILNEWANAHSALLVEEARLVELCRTLAAAEITADQLEAQRERVASLRERSEALYTEVMEFLRGPPS